MSSPANIVRTVRNRQFRTDENGIDWTRKRSQAGPWLEWELIDVSDDEPKPTASQDPLHLYVLQEMQGPGEPTHWSLFLAKEQGNGTEYQVVGDNTFMQYLHETDVDPRTDEAFHNAYEMCEMSERSVQLLDRYANEIPPPRAPDRASVTENCQTWAIKVLRKLQSDGVVGKEAVDSMEGQVQPIT
jgi:hypothetical protein